MKIATGLLLKQNLFEGVLNSTSMTDEVDFSEKGKSQFIKQLEEVMENEGFEPKEQENKTTSEAQEDEELHELLSESEPDYASSDTANEKMDQNLQRSPATKKGGEKNLPAGQAGRSADKTKETDFAQMEEVMTKGMEFLTGIYKMSTGNEIAASGKPKVNVNKETGEVSITFKMGV
jgi:hypothetical protein